MPNPPVAADLGCAAGEVGMNTLLTRIQAARAQNVVVTDDSLTVDLTDGRTISVPLAWYPRLVHGSPQERNNWQLIGNGEGIHWPDLDEDLSIEGLLLASFLEGYEIGAGLRDRSLVQK